MNILKVGLRSQHRLLVAAEVVRDIVRVLIAAGISIIDGSRFVIRKAGNLVAELHVLVRDFIAIEDEAGLWNDFLGELLDLAHAYTLFELEVNTVMLVGVHQDFWAERVDVDVRNPL